MFEIQVVWNKSQENKENLVFVDIVLVENFFRDIGSLGNKSAAGIHHTLRRVHDFTQLVILSLADLLALVHSDVITNHTLLFLVMHQEVLVGADWLRVRNGVLFG